MFDINQQRIVFSETVVIEKSCVLKIEVRKFFFPMGLSWTQEEKKVPSWLDENQMIDEEMKTKLMKKLLDLGALCWTAEQSSEYLAYEGLILLSKLSLVFRIDGECIVECPLEVLEKWFALEPKKIKSVGSGSELMEELKIFKERIRSKLENHELVNVYIHPPPQKLDSQEKQKQEIILKTDQEQTSKLRNETPNDAKAYLRSYHIVSSNSSESGSPSLKRDWIYQPKLCRRYYGCPVQTLHIQKDGNNSSPLGDLLYYSVSLSAFQDETQKSIWPRTAGSKRVNPSSGGLHPNETCKNVITTDCLN